MLIRPATEADSETLSAIYGHHVQHGLATFEEIPPSPGEMDQRRRAIVAYGLPYLVAEEAGRVLGFAYAGPFRPRARTAASLAAISMALGGASSKVPTPCSTWWP